MEQNEKADSITLKFPGLLTRLKWLALFASILLLVASLACKQSKTGTGYPQANTLVIVGEDERVHVSGEVTFKRNPTTGKFEPDLSKPGIIYLFRSSQSLAGVSAKAGEVYQVDEGRKLQKIGEFDLNKSNRELEIEFGISEEEELEFTVREEKVKRYDTDHPPVGGIWEGSTVGEAFWLRVSFEVDPSRDIVTRISCQAGFKGDDHTLASWQPEDGSATIESDGSFEYEDSYGNFIKGRFGTRKYASGTISGLRFTDDKGRTPPVQWRAAPLK